MKYSMILRFVLVCTEVTLLMLFVFPMFRSVINAGNICGILMSLVFLAATLFSDRLIGFITSTWWHKGGRIAIVASACVIAAAVVYAVILSVFMASAYNDPPSEPNVVVVLGCHVKGTTPSNMLQYRLDAAYEYLIENEDTLCIVTGGQGWGEDIPEALAMKDYLVGKGISSDRIIMEDKSTSTEENLKFTAEILTELGLPLEITIVSDGFHQYRAGLMAHDLGYGEVSSISGFTRAYLLPTYWVREWLAITAYFIFG